MTFKTKQASVCVADGSYVAMLLNFIRIGKKNTNSNVYINLCISTQFDVDPVCVAYRAVVNLQPAQLV